MKRGKTTATARTVRARTTRARGQSTARPFKGAKAGRRKARSRTRASGKGLRHGARPSGASPAAAAAAVRRFGQLVGLRPERLPEYKRIHAAVWPEVLGAIREAGIRNYSIFHWGGKLFAYFEYHGPPAEYDERMRALARAPRMREWWDVTDPMQLPLDDREPGSWWAGMEEVFHTD
jgi:L-rhamnose mutarotase